MKGLRIISGVSARRVAMTAGAATIALVGAGVSQLHANAGFSGIFTCSTVSDAVPVAIAEGGVTVLGITIPPVDADVTTLLVSTANCGAVQPFFISSFSGSMTQSVVAQTSAGLWTTLSQFTMTQPLLTANGTNAVPVAAGAIVQQVSLPTPGTPVPGQAGVTFTGTYTLYTTVVGYSDGTPIGNQSGACGGTSACDSTTFAV